MRSRSIAAVLVISAAVLSACASPLAAGGGPDDGLAPAAPPGGVVVTAYANEFDRQQVEAPADRPFPMLFENREAVPHNVAIVDPQSGDSLFAGEIFGGAGARMYSIPALQPGGYLFRCDVHPGMSGTLVAG